MTDLPQLQTLLVEAARRRRRRRRVATVARTFALAAPMLAVVAVVAGRESDPEVAVERPAGTARTVDQAYAVFRRAARPGDRLPRGGIRGRWGRTRLIAQHGLTHQVFLAERGRDLCLVTAEEKKVGSVGCGPVRTYLDGHRPLGSYSDEEGPGPIAFAFPDGVRQVRLTLADGTSATYPVRDNGFARMLRSRATLLEWTAPDGKPESIRFHPAPAFKAADFWPALRRPARAGDDLRGLPGARRVGEGDELGAWLVPRRGAVCLVVAYRGSEVSGCRRKVADVRRALVVGVGPEDRSARTIVAAFPHGIKRISVVRFDRTERFPLSLPSLVIRDGLDVDALRYRSPGGGTSTDRMPASATAFVLNSSNEPPEKIPPP